AVGMLTGGGLKTDANGHFSAGKLGVGSGTLMVLSNSFFSGTDMLVEKSFELGPGEKKDLGTIPAITKKHPEGDAQGDLGFSTDVEHDTLIVTNVDASGAATGVV